MGQKQHKKLRRTAKMMAAMKHDIAKSSGKIPLIPLDQEQYRVDSQVKNNPLSERGTIRWLKKNRRTT